MRFEANGWSLEIDEDKTESFYVDTDDGSCPECCAFCRNYWHGIERAPAALLQFLRGLGINPKRAAHVTWMAKRDTGAQLYTASYLLSGTIAGMPGDRLSVNGDGVQCTKFTGLCGNAYFHFCNELCLPEGVACCPEPALQLDVFCELPWVLDERMPERNRDFNLA